MHSTLRKELCGTPKILRSVRTRSTHRSISRNRRFSTRTYLWNQSGPKDSGANCSGANSRSSDTSGEPPTSQSTPARGIGAELEKWIQAYSERDQSQHIWDTISEKDENGRRRLLPHVKKDLEKFASVWSQDGNASETVGIEIRDGRIHPLTASEIKHDHVAGPSNGENAKKIVIQTVDKSEAIALTADATATSAATPIGNKERDPKKQGISQREAGADAEETPQTLDNNLISKFHGSSAARRQRERQSRTKDREPAVQLPEWFAKRNVAIWGEWHPQIKKQEPPSTQAGDKSIDKEYAALYLSKLDPELAHMIKEVNRLTSEDTVTTEKQQTSADPGENPAPSSASERLEDPHSNPPPTSDGMSGLRVLPNSGRRYYVHEAQRTELVFTARGRLRLPENNSTPNRLGGIRSHLLVHYTAKDGDLFLDRLVEDVAGSMRSNLIRLDAQDISSLISNSDIDPMMVDEAKFLSYDIYEEFYKEDVPGQNDKASFNEDVDDADIDEDGPPGSQGMPFAIGKPITIDLKAIFTDRERNRRNRQAMALAPRNMMTDFMGRPSMPKPLPHVFQSLVDSILSSPSNKQRTFDVDLIQKLKDESWPSPRVSRFVPPDATVVHVKDLKAIQDTNIGKHFLTQLYEQVDRRRSNGEGIMIIGTSCEREEPQYNSSRVRNMQISEPDEISSTIVITPAWPRVGGETDSEAELRNELQRVVIPHGDRVTRLQTINARHLYEMLRSKEISLNCLQDGFWKRHFVNDLHPEDQVCLAETFWTFSYVQRVAAVIAGLEMSKDPQPIARAVKFLDESDKIKFEWADSPPRPKPKWGHRETGTSDFKAPEVDKLARVRSTATKHEKKLLGGVIESEDISTTFKDIHIPKETVEALETLTTLSLVRPDAFKYGVLASDRIPGLLLYGPPGTGKTLAAKAVARESGATILEVSAADINDMYVGEGEKNVKALFSLARKLEPCVVFLDEADSMFSARADAGRRVSHRETINQFLKEWDGMSNDAGSAFLMVATNRPFDLDDAVLRRLPRRLLIDLPTEKDRLEILKIHLRNENLAACVDLAKLAARTPFYSGSDLKNVAVAAALNCVREENELAKQHTGDEPYAYPERRVLTPMHFERALEEIGASISEDMASLRAMKKFDDQYGDKKNRKRRSPKWGFKTAAEADAVLDTVKVRS